MSKTRILILEVGTNPINETEGSLRKLGCDVLFVVDSLEEAADKIEKCSLDLVLIDLQPALETDIVRIIKEIQKRSTLPIVLLAEDSIAEELDQIEIAMPFGIASKPLQSRELKAVMNLVFFAANAEAEKREAEDALNQLKHRFATYVELTPMGMIEFDSEFRIVTWNQGAEGIFGYKAEEVIEKNSFDLILPEYEREKIRKIHLWEAENAKENINDNLTKDGRIITCQWFNTPILNMDNEIVGLTATCQDITEQLKDQQRLRQSEEKYRTIISSMSNIILVIDEDDHFIDVHQGKDVILYQPLQGIKGKKHQDLLPESVNQLYERHAAELRATGQTQKYECALQFEDERWLGVTLDPHENGKYIIASTIDITDQKRMMDDLSRSEETLASIIKNIPDVLYRLDTDGKISFISEYVRKFGYDPAEMIGTSMIDYVHPDDREKAFYKIAERRRGDRKTSSFQIRLIPKAQNLRHFDVKSEVIQEAPVLLLNAEGLYESDRLSTENFLGTQGIVRDITKRYKAEQSLVATKKMLELVIENIPQYIFWKDRNSVYLGCNANFARLAGLESSNAIIGKTDFDLPWKKEAKRYYEEDMGFMTSGKPEFHILEPEFQVEGQKIFRETSKIPLQDNDGQVIGILGTFEDITQRMQTEEDLQEKEVLLKAAGRLARVAGWSADLVKQKIIWSDEVAIIHGKKPGYSPSAEDHQKFIAPEWLERVQEAFAECIRDGSPLEEEMEIITEQGERLWIKTTGELVKNESGEIIGIQGALQDITATKHLGESLRQAQKMEAIGTLAGGIAHDFNNILSGILGYAQIATLHQLTKDHPAHKTVTNIISAADRAAELVKHILTFSRQRPSEKTKTQVVPIVKETLKLIKASIPSTIQITQNFSAEEDLVYADPSAIQQIIMNFSTNAVHAMRESGGNLFLHVEEAHIDEGDQSIKLDLKPGAYLAISVKDTGKGIPKVISDRIFEPYFTTKPVGEGTGLGLSVVHGIVKDLGGAVTVDSEPGKGSLFCAFIPRADSVLQTEKVADNQLHKGSGHILVVDDELIIAETAQDMLEELGYQVTIYTDSREALEVFLNQKDDIDLVLTDMTMPHIRGDQLARKILKIKPECPIILCTGFSELIDEKKAQEIGIRDFIMKPINWTDLTRKIRDALANPLSG